MAIYHCSIKIGSRGAGRSATAASAYRAGDKVKDRETGMEHDFTRKSGVLHDEIMLCKNAPEDYMNREKLWNSVQAAERAKNGQLFREVEVALPIEMTREQQIEAVRAYCRENFIEKGMCVDWALHDKNDGNPHAHIMCTMRGIDENGKWKAKRRTEYARDENGEKIPVLDQNGNQKIGAKGRKLWERVDVPTNDWNDQSKAELWRENWAIACNKYLTPDQKIDHRSFERRGIDKIPTKHEGFAARRYERRGMIASSCELNRKIIVINKARRDLERKQVEIIVREARKKNENALKQYHAELASIRTITRRQDAGGTGTDERNRVKEAIQRRKRLEKLDVMAATRSTDVTKAMEYWKKAKKKMVMKRMVKMSKKNLEEVILKGFDLVSMAARLGNAEAQAFLVNYGGGDKEEWKKEWLYMTEAERDEAKMKAAYRDDY